MLRQIAAPMPRLPPVTSATRPSSRMPMASCLAWVAVASAIGFLPLRFLAPGALAEPVREVGPDLVARLRAGHQADVAAGAVEVRDVGAARPLDQRDRARARRDVVGAGGDDEQVLLDLAQVDAPPAQPHDPLRQAVLLVHRGDPLGVGAAGPR